MARAGPVNAKKLSALRPNAPTPTLGGRQFWADELFFREWHIQRNVFTRHCRLLDGAGVRHGWGSFDECRARLANIRTQRHLPPMRGPAVIALHGLFRSQTSMRRLCGYLRSEGGYTVFNVCYPTTRGSLAEHAARLARLIDGLEGIDEINFVAHSLGNLVIRHYLADRASQDAASTHNRRIRRMVMLGPPNQGARLAEAFATVPLFHWVAGASASQLASGWDALQAKLATPGCEFGIIAGGRGTPTGFNPWLGEDNDMVVSVPSTRLAGAADFAVLPVLHALMMENTKVREYTLRFFQHGYFVSAAERRPILGASQDEPPSVGGLNKSVIDEHGARGSGT
jgi:pimeloyl-ACP methyl ester carboxylesterase